MEKKNLKIKKNRSTNFVQQEIDLLLRLVLNHKGILENKINAGIGKSAVWKTLVNEYNAASTFGFRSEKSLRDKYKNLKKTLRQKKSFERQQVMATGGGAPKASTKMSVALKTGKRRKLSKVDTDEPENKRHNFEAELEFAKERHELQCDILNAERVKISIECDQLRAKHQLECECLQQQHEMRMKILQAEFDSKKRNGDDSESNSFLASETKYETVP